LVALFVVHNNPTGEHLEEERGVELNSKREDSSEGICDRQADADVVEVQVR